MYYCIPTSVGTNHTASVAADATPDDPAASIFFAAFSGVKQTSPFDQINGSNGFASTLQPGSITPTENNELVVALLGINSSGTPMSINSGFTETNTEINFGAGDHYGGCMAYIIQTTAAAVNPTWTRTNTNGMAVMQCSFKVGSNAYTQTLTDVLTLNANATKSTSRTLTDVITLVANALKSTSRTLSDPLVLADTILKMPGKVLTDTLILADSIVRSTARTLSDTLTLVDTVLKSTARTLIDTIVLSDVFTSTKITVKELLETLVLTDTVNKFTSRILTDVVTLADTVTKATHRTVSETIVLADTIVKAASRTLSETIVITDSVLKSIERVLSDTMTLADSIVRSIGKTLSETIVLSDLVTLAKNLNQVAISIGAFTVYSLYGAARTITDSVRSLTLYDTVKAKIIRKGRVN
jgi:hypothetical protein